MKDVHEKAIRLVEGGIVEVDGHSVRLKHRRIYCNPCYDCEMDCLCHKGNDICNLCEECDSILNEDCWLVLMDGK